MTNEQHDHLEAVLSKVGDLNFRRRVITILDYLDIQKTDHVLDAGCGEGFYPMIFSELYECKVTAVDFDQELLDMAAPWLAKYKKVTLAKEDLTNLPYKDNTFDKIVCSEVLEHIVDHEAATKELYRVLKPGGKLAVTVPNQNYPFMWDPLNKIREGLGLGHFNPLNGFWGGIWAYDHKRLYLPRALHTLLTDHNFNVTEMDVLTHYGVPFNHLVLYTGKQFYTKLPVPEDVRQSMEKFDWDETPPSPSIVSRILQAGLAVLTWVDQFNDQTFSLGTSTMAVAALAVKEK